MASKTPIVVKAKAKTISDFKNLHDRSVIVPRKIKDALAKMFADGRENWEYEGDFIKLAGIAGKEITDYREQFKAHIVETPAANGREPRNVWFADVKAAKKIRGE